MGETHQNYYSVSGTDNAEYGFNLGKTFATQAQFALAREMAKPDWEARSVRAKALLGPSQGFSPKYVDEMRAYAEGAGIPFDELWTMSLEGEVGNDESDHCTSLVTNDGYLVGHSEDYDPGTEDHLSILRSNVGGLVRFELWYEHTLGGSGLSVNSHGVIQFINTLHHSRTDGGIPKHLIARWLAETASPEEDLSRLGDLPRHAGYSHSFVDKHGRILNAECTADQHRIIRPETPWVRGNHYLHTELVPFEIADDSTHSHDRVATAGRLVKPHMTAQEMQAVLRNNTDGAPWTISNKGTLASIVVDIRAQTAYVYLSREPNRGWITYPLHDLFQAPHLSTATFQPQIAG